MYPLLYKYLSLNKEVSVPGIGVFYLDREPARLDMDLKVIHAPLSVIKLRAEQREADPQFSKFLADETNTTIDTATNNFQAFCRHLKEEVQEKKWLELPGLGTLTPGVRDEIKFKSAPTVKEYFPSISIGETKKASIADPVITQTVPEPEPVTIATEEPEPTHIQEPHARKDYWWLFAIILALVAAAAIIYYYYYLQPVRL